MSHALISSRPAVWLAAAAGALALTGCVVAPVDDGYYTDAPYYSTGPVTDGYYNGTYYPAIPHEVVPVAPYAGAVWVQGTWIVDNGRRYWRPGRYERPGWNRPNHVRPDQPNWHRPDQPRPHWNRPDRDGNRPNWDRPNTPPRPDANRPSHRPPANHVAPPNPSGNTVRPGAMLRPAPGASGNRPSAQIRPSAPRPSQITSDQWRPWAGQANRPSREFLNRKDPDRGG